MVLEPHRSGIVLNRTMRVSTYLQCFSPCVHGITCFFTNVSYQFSVAVVKNFMFSAHIWGFVIVGLVLTSVRLLSIMVAFLDSDRRRCLAVSTGTSVFLVIKNCYSNRGILLCVDLWLVCFRYVDNHRFHQYPSEVL